MKNDNEKMKVSTLALAVNAALIAMFALPVSAEESVVVLPRPANFLELGVGNISASSAKFGEYTGLDTQGNGVVGISPNR
jgi:hypothetical protein